MYSIVTLTYIGCELIQFCRTIPFLIISQDTDPTIYIVVIEVQQCILYIINICLYSHGYTFDSNHACWNEYILLTMCFARMKPRSVVRCHAIEWYLILVCSFPAEYFTKNLESEISGVVYRWFLIKICLLYLPHEYLLVPKYFILFNIKHNSLPRTFICIEYSFCTSEEWFASV